MDQQLEPGFDLSKWVRGFDSGGHDGDILAGRGHHVRVTHHANVNVVTTLDLIILDTVQRNHRITTSGLNSLLRRSREWTDKD